MKEHPRMGVQCYYRLFFTNCGSLIALSRRRLRKPVYPFPVARAFSSVSGEILRDITGLMLCERLCLASSAISAYCSGVSSGASSSGVTGSDAANSISRICASVGFCPEWITVRMILSFAIINPSFCGCCHSGGYNTCGFVAHGIDNIQNAMNASKNNIAIFVLAMQGIKELNSIFIGENQSRSFETDSMFLNIGFVFLFVLFNDGFSDCFLHVIRITQCITLVNDYACRVISPWKNFCME